MEKYGYPPVHTPIRERRQPFHASTRAGVKYMCLFAALVMLLLWHLMNVSQQHQQPEIIVDSFSESKFPEGSWTAHTDLDDGTWKVPLEAHIMFVCNTISHSELNFNFHTRSKCPDALECLQQLLVPALSRTTSKVNFTLSYIGTLSEDGVACMHGPTECLGNILELCAADTYPDPKIYLGFTLCLSQRYTEIPSRALVEDCSMEHGVDFAKLNDCASKEDGAYGMGLLRNSVERSKSVGAGISCTLRLSEEVRCVRDGGEWKQCPRGSAVGDLVKDIDRLYSEGNGIKKTDRILKGMV
jgi:Gamma interferon inducible lysosomal thiol reductase (GILT)